MPQYPVLPPMPNPARQVQQPMNLGAPQTMMPPATPQGIGLGAALKSFLTSPEAGALASGLLGGGSNSDAIGRGFQNMQLQGRVSQADRKEKEVANLTKEWLRSKGANQQIMALAEQDPGMAFKMWDSQQKLEKGTGGVYGTPIYGVDADGKTTLGVIGKNGEYVPVDTGGTTPTQPIQWLDTGTGHVAGSRQTGQVLPGSETIPKDNRGAARESAIGAEEGKKVAGAPQALANADAMIGIIDKLISHPGRETATGMSGLIDPRNYIRGTEAKDYALASEQLEGAVFLEAFDTLKGGGQITEVEGKKATAAKAQLARAQGDKQYLEALQELKRIVNIGRDRAMRGVKVLQDGREVPMGTPDPAAPVQGMPAPASPTGAPPPGASADEIIEFYKRN